MVNAYNMVPSISPFRPFLSFSDIPGKGPNLSRISMGFKNKTKTHWSCNFPFPDKPKADGLKQTKSGWWWGAWVGKSGSQRAPKRGCSLEKWCREILAAKYTPWHWYKGQRGRTFWILWSQEHSIKRRGKENVTIKRMKYIKVVPSPEGPNTRTAWMCLPVPGKEVNGEGSTFTPSYPSIRREPHWWFLDESMWYYR